MGAPFVHMYDFRMISTVSSERHETKSEFRAVTVCYFSIWGLCYTKCFSGPQESKG